MPTLKARIGGVWVALASSSSLPGAWTNVTFQNGWSNLGGFAGAAYRLVGDKVELRGLVTRSTAVPAASSSIIFTLPAGFRPPGALLMTGVAAGPTSYGEMQARIDVNVNGDVTVLSGSASQNVHVYLSLSNISFSVTP
jgi:hypothetical protein